MNLIVFGATGDLAKKKIKPALQSLGIEALSYGRREVAEPGYIQGELDHIHEKLNGRGITHAYVALPPSQYAILLRQLAQLDTIPRIALEKPFGTSLAHAEELIQLIEHLHLRDHIYLVDHYLGKPALMNWQRKDKEINSIHIDGFETQGIGERGNFYESVGAVKDYIQSHVIAMLGVFLCNINKLKYVSDSLIVGQYEGYKDSRGVDADSTTETYAACTFEYNKKTDVYVRVGKALSESKIEVKIQYADGNSEVVSIQSNVNAHEAVLQDFLDDNDALCVPFDLALNAWQITEKIVADKVHTKLLIYPQGSDADTIV